MNKVILIGNLTKDPERRVNRSGVTTCSFTLAVERDHKDKDGNRPVDFINVIAWRNTADLCARYLTKGRQAAVIGTWQNRGYEDKDGNKRTVAECIADDTYEIECVEKALTDLNCKRLNYSYSEQ